MDSIRLKTKELQSKMYLTQTHRLRLIDSLDSQKRSTPNAALFLKLGPWPVQYIIDERQLLYLKRI